MVLCLKPLVKIAPMGSTQKLNGLHVKLALVMGKSHSLLLVGFALAAQIVFQASTAKRDT